MAGPKTVVFIDYQNVHHSGHRNFCNEHESMDKCVVHPVRLAETVAGLRAPGADLQGVRVYRGRPNPNFNRKGASANDQQKLHWESEKICKVERRLLMYPDDWGQPDCVELPREKGIDVALSVDLVMMAMRGEFEVGIVVSRDTDLKPAIEAVHDMPGPHVEVATWKGDSRIRLDDRGKKLYCHWLDEQDFKAVRDTKYYPVL